MLLLGNRNPRYVYRVGEEFFLNSAANEVLGILLDGKVDMSQLCMIAVWKANSILGCMNRGVTSKERR